MCIKKEISSETGHVEVKEGKISLITMTRENIFFKEKREK